MTPETRQATINAFARAHAFRTSDMARTIKQDNETKVKFMNTLHNIIARRPETPRNKVGAPLLSDYDMVAAQPTEIAEAALVALGEIQPIKP